jgi:hypothetical protein
LQKFIVQLFVATLVRVYIIHEIKHFLLITLIRLEN